jgi:hypothetical protein
MGVSYTKAQRELAKREGLHLVTLAAKGIEVQAPVSKEEMDWVAAFILDFIRRRSEWLNKPKEG